MPGELSLHLSMQCLETAEMWLLTQGTMLVLSQVSPRLPVKLALMSPVGAIPCRALSERLVAVHWCIERSWYQIATRYVKSRLLQFVFCCRLQRGKVKEFSLNRTVWESQSFKPMEELCSSNWAHNNCSLSQVFPVSGLVCFQSPVTLFLLWYRKRDVLLNVQAAF